MDIGVTTPNSQREASAREAADCLRHNEGWYFRRFAPTQTPRVVKGDRVYYVEDGYIRGFAVVDRVQFAYEAQRCDTTGRQWAPGVYVFMDAASWNWIGRIPMKGFRGFRYVHYRDGGQFTREWMMLGGKDYAVSIVGGWKMPRPREQIVPQFISFPSADAGDDPHGGLTHHQSFDVARSGAKARTTDKLRPKDRPLANDFISDDDFARMLLAWFGNIARRPYQTGQAEAPARI